MATVGVKLLIKHADAFRTVRWQLPAAE